MPFPMIPTALGLCFLLVWAFIAGMVFRDGQRAAQRDREMDSRFLPLESEPPLRIAGSNATDRPGSGNEHPNQPARNQPARMAS